MKNRPSLPTHSLSEEITRCWVTHPRNKIEPELNTLEHTRSRISLNKNTLEHTRSRISLNKNKFKAT